MVESETLSSSQGKTFSWEALMSSIVGNPYLVLCCVVLLLLLSSQQTQSYALKAANEAIRGSVNAHGPWPTDSFIDTTFQDDQTHIKSNTWSTCGGCRGLAQNLATSANRRVASSSSAFGCERYTLLQALLRARRGTERLCMAQGERARRGRGGLVGAGVKQQLVDGRQTEGWKNLRENHGAASPAAGSWLTAPDGPNRLYKSARTISGRL